MHAPPPPAARRTIHQRDLVALLRAITVDAPAFDARLWSVADAEVVEAAAAAIRRGLAALPAASRGLPRYEWLERELTRRADEVLASALVEVVERTAPGD
jgi:hypothetical protein